ncbi:MAG TPA: site-specific DNA-methyltransferase [Polyangiales bacterium]|jgi:DNA modification methylase|nr:site-specific DNA-methyltransferase [Polyangiales bacterium]
MKPRLQLLTGHCVDELNKLEPQSVQCIVTSPPYLWLRDYGTEPVAWPEIHYTPMIGMPPVVAPAQVASLGLEQDIASYVAHIVHVFRAAHRVLRRDGLCWINIGDSYASGGRSGGGSFMEERGDASWKGASAVNGWRKPPPGFGRKDMLGMPWRVAYALQADGWRLRSDVIWQKPNCMPQSAEDRPTSSHEYLFLFSRSDEYFYDGDAIREPVTGGSHTRGGGVGGKAVPPGRGAQGRIRQNQSFGRAVRELVTSRNKRTVWSIPTEAFKGKHFATFPRALARPCILASTSAEGCCYACGAPRRRQVVIEGPSFNELTKGRAASNYAAAWDGNPHSFAVRGSHGHIARVRKTVGWEPTCKCDEKRTRPCAVLDMFGGSGTVGVVAIAAGRSCTLIDLSHEYSQQAIRRLARETVDAGWADAASAAEEPNAAVQLGLLGYQPDAEALP